MRTAVLMSSDKECTELPGPAYRSDGRGDAGLVHRPDPRVVWGFDDGHPLLFL